MITLFSKVSIYASRYKFFLYFLYIKKLNNLKLLKVNFWKLSFKSVFIIVFFMKGQALGGRKLKIITKTTNPEKVIFIGGLM